MQRWRWWQTWCTLPHLPPNLPSKLLVFFIWLFDSLRSPSTVWINLSLRAVPLAFFFIYFMSSPPSVRGVPLCFRCLVYLFLWKLLESFPSPALPPASLSPPFIAPHPPHKRLDVVTSSRSAVHSTVQDLVHGPQSHSCEFSLLSLPVQDFPLLRLDDIVDEQSNIVGFSMFNTTHPFYLEFIRSLNLSWREGCDLTYPGPAVSLSIHACSRVIFNALFVRLETLSCFIPHSD